MVVQKYIDCNKCGRRFAVCFIDDERRTIKFYPMNYFDRSNRSIKICELNLEQIPNPEDPNKKFINIPCPVCGNFSVSVVDRDWMVFLGSVESLASSLGVEI